MAACSLLLQASFTPSVHARIDGSPRSWSRSSWLRPRILLVLGQPAVFAISLLMIGSYLFLRGRLLPLGALLFMLSLAVKPQIGGLIVLYFLAQRIHWRYAAAALAGAAALLLCGSLILGHHPRSADWTSTLSANLSATLSPGGSADPRPANQQSIGDVNLQALTSIFFVDARRFNARGLLDLSGPARAGDYRHACESKAGYPKYIFLRWEPCRYSRCCLSIIAFTTPGCFCLACRRF